MHFKSECHGNNLQGSKLTYPTEREKEKSYLQKVANGREYVGVSKMMVSPNNEF